MCCGWGVLLKKTAKVTVPKTEPTVSGKRRASGGRDEESPGSGADRRRRCHPGVQLDACGLARTDRSTMWECYRSDDRPHAGSLTVTGSLTVKGHHVWREPDTGTEQRDARAHDDRTAHERNGTGSGERRREDRRGRCVSSGEAASGCFRCFFILVMVLLQPGNPPFSFYQILSVVPNFVRRVDDQLEFLPLRLFAEEVAFLHRGKTTLCAQRQIF